MLLQIQNIVFNYFTDFLPYPLKFQTMETEMRARIVVALAAMRVAKVHSQVPEKPPPLKTPLVSEMLLTDWQEWYVLVYPSLVETILAQHRSVPSFWQIASEPGMQ